MQTVLFTSTIFGPIHSRRLGVSLGVNLSPTDGKTCTFDCLYCEAGFNAQGSGKSGLPSAEQVGEQLEQRLRQMSDQGERLDVITFSGNGEPTIHPRFEPIIDRTIALRDKWYPQAKISVLSNSTRLADPAVCRALHRVDNNILKLDSAIDATIRIIDRPVSPTFTFASLLPGLQAFAGECIIQTMMVTGEHQGSVIDNTTDAEIEALIETYRAIRPRQVMLYSIDRKTPAEHLQKVSRQRLEEIAALIRAEGIDTLTV